MLACVGLDGQWENAGVNSANGRAGTNGKVGTAADPKIRRSDPT